MIRYCRFYPKDNSENEFSIKTKKKTKSLEHFSVVLMHVLYIFYQIKVKA